MITIRTILRTVRQRVKRTIRYVEGTEFGDYEEGVADGLAIALRLLGDTPTLLNAKYGDAFLEEAKRMHRKILS